MVMFKVVEGESQYNKIMHLEFWLEKYERNVFF